MSVGAETKVAMSAWRELGKWEGSGGLVYDEMRENGI